MPTTSLYTTSLIGDNMGHFYPNPKFKTITNYDGGDCIAWCIEKKGVIHMANVWVHPETRGEGRGMQMMKEIRNHFPNHQIITDIQYNIRQYLESFDRKFFIPILHINRDIC